MSFSKTLQHVTLIGLLGGCSEAASVASAPAERRDSAGIQIAEHQALPAGLPTWHVSPAPSISLGSVEGPGADVFGDILAVHVRSDGLLMVADSRAAELKTFDRFGNHIWSAGRSGEGPGEFDGLGEAFLLPGDSTFAITHNRASVFDREGRYVRELRFEGVPEGHLGPTIVGTADGKTLIGTRMPFPEIRTGYYRTQIIVSTYDLDGRHRNDFAEFPSSEGIFSTSGDMYRSTLAPFGRSAQIAVGTGMVAISTQDTFEILLFDPKGAQTGTIRVKAPPSSIDASMRRRFTEFRLSQINEEGARRIAQEMLNGNVFPATVPALGQIRLDASNRLWVERYSAPYEEAIPVWWVLDTGGSFLAAAELPVNFVPYVIMEDEILGVFTDELGVQRVEIRSIQK